MQVMGAGPFYLGHKEVLPKKENVQNSIWQYCEYDYGYRYNIFSTHQYCQRLSISKVSYNYLTTHQKM